MSVHWGRGVLTHSQITVLVVKRHLEVMEVVSSLRQSLFVSIGDFVGAKGGIKNPGAIVAKHLKLIDPDKKLTGEVLSFFFFLFVLFVFARLWSTFWGPSSVRRRGGFVSLMRFLLNFDLFSQAKTAFCPKIHSHTQEEFSQRLSDLEIWRPLVHLQPSSWQPRPREL